MNGLSKLQAPNLRLHLHLHLHLHLLIRHLPPRELQDLNCGLQISVGSAGPQPRAPKPSGHCRTPTVSTRAQWALQHVTRERQISMGTVKTRHQPFPTFQNHCNRSVMDHANLCHPTSKICSPYCFIDVGLYNNFLSLFLDPKILLIMLLQLTCCCSSYNVRKPKLRGTLFVRSGECHGWDDRHLVAGLYNVFQARVQVHRIGLSDEAWNWLDRFPTYPLILNRALLLGIFSICCCLG